MQRDASRSSQLGLTSGIRQERSEFVAEPKREQRRGRVAARRGQLRVLVEPAAPSGGVSAAAKLVMGTIEDEYYHGPAPSITTALEEAVKTANRLLVDFNSGAPTHKKTYLGVACVVTHGSEAYIALVQPAHALAVHQGTARAFPPEGPKSEAELTPLGLARELEVELYRSPWSPGDTMTLMTAGIAALVSRSEDEYSLAYQGPTGAIGYLAHLAARENLLDEHAVVIEQAPPATAGGLETLGRDWIGQTAARAKRSLGEIGTVLTQRTGGASPAGGGAAAMSWIRQGSKRQPAEATVDGPKRERPSRVQVIATLVGGALLLLLALGLGTRAYQAYRDNAQFEALLASADSQQKRARGTPTDIALRRLAIAQEQVVDAKAIRPDDQRVREAMARIQADRDLARRVVRLAQLTSVASVADAPTGVRTRLMVRGNDAVVFDPRNGTIRSYDLVTKTSTALSPTASTRFVGAAMRSGDIHALDSKGKVWRYDVQDGDWRSTELGGTHKWTTTRGFDVYRDRAYITFTSRKAVLVYSLDSPERPQALVPGDAEHPYLPASLSAGSAVWLVNGKDDSLLKLSSGRITRRVWPGAEPRMKGAYGLVAREANEHLYVLDKQGDRVLQVTPSGALEAQLSLPERLETKGKITAAFADEDAARIYLLVGNQIFRAPLPEAGRPKG